ncbi:MAG: hypothetical protein ABH827_00260 [bacterium]
MRKILFILTLFCLFGVHKISGIEKKIETFKQSLTTLKQKLVALSGSLNNAKQKLAKPNKPDKPKDPKPVNPILPEPKPEPNVDIAVETDEERKAREEQEKIEQEEARKEIEKSEEQEKKLEEKRTQWKTELEKERLTRKTCELCKKEKDASKFPELLCGCNAPKNKKFYCKNEYNKVQGPIWATIDGNNWTLLKCVGCSRLIRDTDFDKIVTNGITGGYPNINQWGEVFISGGTDKTKKDRIELLNKDVLKPEMKKCNICLEEKPLSEFPELKCGCNKPGQETMYCLDEFNSAWGCPIQRILDLDEGTELTCFDPKHRNFLISDSDEELEKIVTDGRVGGFDLGEGKIGGGRLMEKKERINRLKFLAKRSKAKKNNTDENYRECSLCNEYYRLGNGQSFHEINPMIEINCFGQNEQGHPCLNKYHPACKKFHKENECQIKKDPNEIKKEAQEKERNEQSLFLNTQNCPKCGQSGGRGGACQMINPCGHPKFCFGCRHTDAPGQAKLDHRIREHHTWACRNGYIYSSEANQPQNNTTFIIRFGKEVNLDFTFFTKYMAENDTRPIKYPKPGNKPDEYIYEYSKQLKEKLIVSDPQVTITTEIKKFYAGENKQTRQDVFVDVPELKITTKSKTELQEILDVINKEFNLGVFNVPPYTKNLEWYQVLYEPDEWNKEYNEYNYRFEVKYNVEENNTQIKGGNYYNKEWEDRFK